MWHRRRQMEGYDPLIMNMSSGFTLTWRRLSVCVKRTRICSRQVQNNQNKILDNVSGVVKSGMFLAIMGASGAGKTTLLTAISQRRKGGVEGEIMVNGQRVSRDFMTQISGFVPQQDLFVDCLSVTEHLQFMVNLKVKPGRYTMKYFDLIEILLLETCLEKCRHTRICDISGGEKKRLSLAVQLLTDPYFLFCDEPTTGLDSNSTTIVVQKLRKLAAHGKAVVCTIHQPPSGIFDLFSHVIFVAGGRVAYQGDVLGAKTHFERLGLVCPPTYNQAEFFISQLAAVPGSEKQSFQKINKLCDEFLTSAYGNELTQQVSFASNYRNMMCNLGYKHDQNSFNFSFEAEVNYFEGNYKTWKPGIWTQFYWLAWRSILDMRRNISHIFMHFTLYMLVALLISLPYVDVKVDQKGIQSLQGLLYLIITETIFTFMYSVTNVFPQELPVLIREISSGLYHPAPYYASKVFILLPRSVVGPTLFTGLVFWFANLDGGVPGFLVFCVPVILSATAATAYGCLMSALFESVSTCALVSAPLDFVGLTFSGLFLHLSTLPPHLSWIKYTSPFYYGTEAISILQWRHVQNISCCTSASLPCISSGDGVLQQYGYNKNHLPIDMTGLISFCCICHFVAFLAIWFRSKSQPTY